MEFIEFEIMNVFIFNSHPVPGIYDFFVDENGFNIIDNNKKYTFVFRDRIDNQIAGIIKQYINNPVPYLKFDGIVEYINGYNVKINLRMHFYENNNLFIKYLNHDILLKEFLLNDYCDKLELPLDHRHMKLNQKIDFGKIITPIFKSNIELNGFINLYEYQKNSIELLINLIKPFKIEAVNLGVKLNSKKKSKMLYLLGGENKFSCEKKYVNVYSNGGILADEMGLGKTITMITFVENMGPFPSKFEKSIDPKLKIKSNGCLIIVPSHLAKQWEGEIKKVCGNQRKVKLFLSKKDHNITLEELLEYDYVIVTQQFLTNVKHYIKYPLYYNHSLTYFNVKKKMYHVMKQELDKLLKLNPIFELIYWRNLIIDEAHEIMGDISNKKNYNRVLREYFYYIQSDYKWYVSGTPFIDHDSLRNIYRILNISIQEENEVPIYFENCKYKKMYFSDYFINKIVIRHTKEQVKKQLNLTKLNEKIYWLTQTQTEKNIYNGSINKGTDYLLRLCCHLMVADTTYTDVKTIDIETIQKNILLKNEQKLKLYQNKLLHLDDTNQSYHMLKKNYENIISQCKYMLDSIKNLNEKLDNNDENCPICLDVITQPTILNCGHIYCLECLSHLLSQKCPLCKVPIESKVKISKKINDNNDTLIKKYGVKTGTLIKLVRKLTSNKENNIIIFSQYDFMLKLISKTLSSNGVNNSFVKGSVYQRNNAINKFKGLKMGNENQVIMLSLKNSASGTHLVEANHIIFIDPINEKKEIVKDIENQAIARAHRIGQERDITIHRLLIKDTVEEKIYKKNY